LSPRTSARLLAGGRLAIGAALVVAPELATRGWLGKQTAAQPSTQVAVRALGVRDMLLGFLALHTVDNEQAGPRMMRACAACDAVDAGATFAARRSLPAAGAWGTIALAAVASLRGLQVSRQLSA